MPHPRLTTPAEDAGKVELAIANPVAHLAGMANLLAGLEALAGGSPAGRCLRDTRHLLINALHQLRLAQVDARSAAALLRVQGLIDGVRRPADVPFDEAVTPPLGIRYEA
jgi:hypothetical protein